jgi:hypothetical protein
MAGLSVEEFDAQVHSICSKSLIVRDIVRYGEGADWVNLRAYLTDESMLNVFYNHKTGKTSFVHIRDGKRVFGADSRNGWHWHPREDPSQHIPSDHAIAFEEFFREIEKVVK